MVTYRKERYEDEVKKIISEIFLKEMSNENFGFVTVTRVKATPDFREARIYVSILENDEKKRLEYFGNIRKKASAIRFMLGKQLIARFVPKLVFFEDDSQRYAAKIEHLIREIHKNDENANE